VRSAAGHDVEPPDSRSRDKRLHRRYPIALEAECKLLRRGGGEFRSSGITVNISSGGVLISSGRVLLEVENILIRGARVEVGLVWPFALDGACPLKLVMRGRVVRTAGSSFAVRTDYYEFRTAGFSRAVLGGAFRGLP
jgi:hypothetical protein